MASKLRERAQADSPLGLAYRMAGYIKDASYIRSMVLRDYGRAPSLSEIKRMVQHSEAEREEFKRLSEERGKYEGGDTEDGEDYRVPYIGPKRLVTGYEERNRFARDVDAIAAKAISRTAHIKPPKDPHSASSLIEAVAVAFHARPEEIRSKSRYPHLMAARAVAARLLHERSPRAYTGPKIATLLGRNDGKSGRDLLAAFESRWKHQPGIREVYLALGGKDAD